MVITKMALLKFLLCCFQNIEELTCKIKELETKLDDEKYDKDCLATELNETKLSIKQGRYFLLQHQK